MQPAVDSAQQQSITPTTDIELTLCNNELSPSTPLQDGKRMSDSLSDLSDAELQILTHYALSVM